MHKQRHPSSNYARILFRHLRLSEENHRGFFQGTDVTYDELMSLDGTISGDELSRMYRNARAISDQEDLGLSVGVQLHLSAHGPLGVATYSCPDLRTALNLLATYGQTRTEIFDISLHEHPTGLRVNFAEAQDLGDLRVFVTESVLSGLFSAIHFFIGVGQFNGECFFAYPKPSYGYAYHDHFGHKITFDHSATEIIVPESLLSTPSIVADPVLHQQAVAICEAHLQQIRAGQPQTELTTEEVISRLISDNPGKLWTLSDVASNLCMSPRTLIRKLDAEGTKFQKIRDELAKQQVIHYLAEDSLSIESIGHLMGFSDSSSFRRSFKRWFGETPSQYRARSQKP